MRFRLRLPAPTSKKIGSGADLKVAAPAAPVPGSGSATLSPTMRIQICINQTKPSCVSDLKPKVACQLLPGLPAYCLFMLIRHLDHINDDKNVRGLIQVDLVLFRS